MGLHNTDVLIRAVILIPAYNSAATIQVTLESIQKQAQGLERIAAVYLADDSSSDATIAIAQRCWRSVDAPLKILCGRVNLGERANLNRAVASISEPYDWLLILHADDIVKPHWLALMMDRMAKCEATIGSICSSWDALMSDGAFNLGEDDPHRSVVSIAGSEQAVRDTLVLGCWWHLSGCAIRRQTLADVGGFHPQLPQLGDWEWLLRCLSRGWSVEYIPRTLMLYRQSLASVSSISFQIDRDIRERLLILRRYRELLGRRRLIHLHARLLYAVTRRMGRALLNRSGRRLLLAGQTALLALGSLVIGLSETAQPQPERAPDEQTEMSRYSSLAQASQ
jgi:glycosyltransferase involved in cell wall biosynthesis